MLRITKFLESRFPSPNGAPFCVFRNPEKPYSLRVYAQKSENFSGDKSEVRRAMTAGFIKMRNGFGKLMSPFSRKIK